MSLAPALNRPVRPPAPPRPEGPLHPLRLLYGLWKNPIATWTRPNFELPVIESDSVLGRLLILNEPAAIRRVFVDHAANYRKDPLQLRVLRPGLGDGLLTAEGEDWRAQRRALAPLFTPRAVASFLPAMAETADWLVRRWTPLRDGRRIDAASEMSRATLDVLERTIFPQGLGRDPGEFARAMSEFFESIGRLHPFDVIDAPSWLPRFGRRPGAPAQRFFGEAVAEIVAARREWLAANPQAQPPVDLLSRLLAATDPQTCRGLDEAQVRANILTFIGAGHETTANALAWSLYLLAADPAWREEVEREVDAASADAPDEATLAGLVKTRATIDEALRLYPPAPTLSREAIAADELAGRRVRPGTIVIVSPWVLHRHRTLWEDPEAFEPRRFLPGRREAIDRFAYLPFGAGPRVCIGMGFALQEATVLLAAIVRRFRLDLAPGHVVAPVQRVTLRPKGGMPMLLRRRN
jgi:cytochrome P450